MSWLDGKPNGKPGVWKKGKRTIKGRWEFDWGAGVFHIWLESTDPVTGALRNLTIYGDKPEWGDWKLQEKEIA